MLLATRRRYKETHHSNRQIFPATARPNRQSKRRLRNRPQPNASTRQPPPRCRVPNQPNRTQRLALQHILPPFLARKTPAPPPTTPNPLNEPPLPPRPRPQPSPRRLYPLAHQLHQHPPPPPLSYSFSSSSSFFSTTATAMLHPPHRLGPADPPSPRRHRRPASPQRRRRLGRRAVPRRQRRGQCGRFAGACVGRSLCGDAASRAKQWWQWQWWWYGDDGEAECAVLF